MANFENTAAIINQINQSLSAITTKPGWTKTEFWTSFGTTLLGIGLTYVQGTPYGAVAAAVTALGYTIARSVVQSRSDANKTAVVNAAINAASAPPDFSKPGRM